MSHNETMVPHGADIAQSKIAVNCPLEPKAAENTEHVYMLHSMLQHACSIADAALDHSCTLNIRVLLVLELQA